MIHKPLSAQNSTSAQDTSSHSYLFNISISSHEYVVFFFRFILQIGPRATKTNVGNVVGQITWHYCVTHFSQQYLFCQYCVQHGKIAIYVFEFCVSYVE